MTKTQITWRLHRWLGWIVGLQVVVWVTSGVLFAWLPFDPWVKGGDQFQRPVLGVTALPPALEGLEAGKVTALAAVATPHGPAWRVGVQGDAAPRYVPLAGGEWTAPDAPAVQRFAATLLKQPAAVRSVDLLPTVPRRLGIVDETGGRGNVWRVQFDDMLGTRIYLDGQGGDFVAIRNEAWVWYDFFWRLHIMDYLGGHDFNNTLLRIAAVFSWGLVAAGAVLAVLALRRSLRRRA